jgi:hypothetical protein
MVWCFDMAIKLNKFISKLDKLTKNPIKYLDAQKDIKYCLFRIIYQMTYYTITDTAYARLLIIKKFADKYGFDADDLNETYRYWEKHGYPDNRFRNFDGEGSDISETTTNNSYTLKISANDDGLYNQYTNPNYNPSSAVDGRENTRQRFKPMPFHYIKNIVESGDWNNIEEMDIAIDKVLQQIEYYLFNN